MRGQVRRCRDALTTLSASAGSVRLAGGAVVALDQYVKELCQECEANRPGKPVSLTRQGTSPIPEIIIDRSLSQALMNIIDNAQKASTEQVAVIASWDTETLDISVADNGPGVPEAIQLSIGKEPIAMGSDGLGLGLFLAHSVIHRFGGTVELKNRPNQGTVTTVKLPLTNLRA